MNHIRLIFTVLFLLALALVFQNFSPISGGFTAISQYDPDFKQERSPQSLGEATIQVGDMLLENGLLQYLINGDDSSSISRAMSEDPDSPEAASRLGYQWTYNGVVYELQPWPNGQVAVQFQDGITEEQKELFFEYCSDWGETAEAECVERVGATVPWVKVTANGDEGCIAHVGAKWVVLGTEYAPGWHPDPRRINLASHCWNERNILHELGHSLGLFHEHQRPDRDQFITVNWDAIDPDYQFTYEVYNFMSFDTQYDFLSIMHYWDSAFAAGDLPTMTPTQDYIDSFSLEGVNRQLSSTDREAAENIYGVRACGENCADEEYDSTLFSIIYSIMMGQ